MGTFKAKGLRLATFESVANLAGGMLRWRAEGRVVENAGV